MGKKQSNAKRRVPKTGSRLPDLGQPKSAVLNSLSSVDAQRGCRLRSAKPRLGRRHSTREADQADRSPARELANARTSRALLVHARGDSTQE